MLPVPDVIKLFGNASNDSPLSNVISPPPALMPPLCTAGYGLAEGNFIYFSQAMYLFTINTIFIALATFIVLKLLNFPMHKYANAAKRKRYKTIAAVLGIVVMIPAIYTFINVYKENKINTQIAAFVKNEIESNDFYLLMESPYYPETKTLELKFFNEVGDAEKNSLENSLRTDPRYADLINVKLKIKGSDTKSFDLITTAYKEKIEELKESKNIIEGLQKKIKDLEQTISNLNNRIEQDALNRNEKIVAFSRISKEAKIRYNNLTRIDFANVLSSKDFIKIDTIPQVTVQWNENVSDSIVRQKEIELRNWLQNQMKLDTLFIKREK